VAANAIRRHRSACGRVDHSAATRSSAGISCVLVLPGQLNFVLGAITWFRCCRSMAATSRLALFEKIRNMIREDARHGGRAPVKLPQAHASHLRHLGRVIAYMALTVTADFVTRSDRSNRRHDDHTAPQSG